MSVNPRCEIFAGLKKTGLAPPMPVIKPDATANAKRKWDVSARIYCGTEATLSSFARSWPGP